MSRRVNRRLCATALPALFLGFGCQSPGGQAPETPLPARSNPADPPTPKQGNPKLAHVLFELGRQTPAEAAATADLYGLRLRDGRVTVVLQPLLGRDSSSIDRAWIATTGAQVTGSTRDVLRVDVPVDRLAQLAAGPTIRAVRTPYRAKHGAVTSQGVALTGANGLQSTGTTGAGVKVAIVDLGFTSLTSAISAGELPAYLSDSTHGVSFDGTSLQTSTVHGTGVAEVVHDMAPDAELYAYKIGDDIDLSNAVDVAISRGVQAINHSVGWVNASFYDGTGPLHDIVARARANDILWANAAGNDARSHWTGSWSDPDGDGWLNFADGTEDIVLAGSTGTAQTFLNWDDYPASSNDYDFYLYDKNGFIAARSEGFQTGTQEPSEALAANLNSTKAPYRLRVRRYSASGTSRFHVFSFNHDFSTNAVAVSSLMDPAPSAAAVAVGAMSVGAWDTTMAIESFSSQGPTSDGRVKPELTGPDGNASFIYGSFFGTSSASPHVAGMTALLRELHPTFDVPSIQALLEAEAADLGASGKDNVFGAGKLRAPAAGIGCTSDADCGDGNACNGVETCDLEAGACAAGPPLMCNDGNPCTADACDAAIGCTAAPVADGTGCSDGNACNGGETCQAGSCAAGTPLSCSDGDACNGVESCDPSTGCVAGTPVVCSDGNPCNGVESCQAGSCAAGTPLSCSDGDACNGVESCDPSAGCVAGTPVVCSDGNPCNGVESCQAGSCAAGAPPVCSDGDACNGVESCDPSAGCVTGTPVVCNDGNVCTADACDPTSGACSTAALADGTACSDGDACNGTESCQAGSCTPGAALSCSDGDVCNGAETCSPSTGCVAGDPLACDTGSECLAPSCDPTNGCASTPVAAGTPCGAGTGTCEAGACETGPRLSRGTVGGVGSGGWAEVVLAKTYRSPVVIATPNYNNATQPGVVRLRSAAGNRFEVRVDTTNATPIVGVSVHYLVVEEGTYTVAAHGVKLEAKKFTSTVTDRKGSWSGESRTYGQSYTSPVVLGQVMTYNDARFSVFWSRGSSTGSPPSASTLRVGKHVGEDLMTTRANETIGYLVVEAGSGAVDGIRYAAALGADTVRGTGNAPPYSYGLGGSVPFSVGVASQAAMDGNEGSWAILYGPAPVSSTNLSLAAEEDNAFDSERSHTTEQVAYIVFE